MSTPSPSATLENITPEVFAVLAKFINQRSGIDPRNYDGRRAFLQETRSISRDGTRARKLLKHAQEYPFNPAAMLDASRAYSGRLQFVMDRDKLGIEYCTGQYFPTEYRNAAAAVLETYIHAVKPRELPKDTDQFYTIADLATANERKGGHWFSPKTKRFFASRILPTLYKGTNLIWFVSSEKSGFDDRSPRRFTVRVFDTKTADINTAGEHLAYLDSATAAAYARECARQDLAGEHRKPLDDREKCNLCGSYGANCKGHEVAS